MPRFVRNYSEETRTRALNLVQKDGLSYTRAAKVVGVHHNTVTRWAHEALYGTPTPDRCDRSPRVIPEHPHTLALLAERDALLAKVPWQDPNFLVLGDPPPWRSALNQRRPKGNQGKKISLAPCAA